mgnify:CR=1 FL=1
MEDEFFVDFVDVDEFEESDVGVDVGSERLVGLAEAAEIFEVIPLLESIFDGLNDLLLSFGAIEVRGRFPAAGVFECVCAVHAIFSFVDLVGVVTTIFIWILMVIDIFFDGDVDTSDDVDHFFKTFHVDDDVFCWFDTCDFFYSLCENVDAEELIEFVYLSSFDGEITRNADEIGLLRFCLGDDEYDRVGEISVSSDEQECFVFALLWCWFEDDFL